MRAWRQRVVAARRVALDTNALIYFLDRTMPYYPLCAAVLALAENGRLESVVPTLAEAELLVGLLRRGDEAGIARLKLLLECFPGLQVAPLDRAAALEAARRRAELGLPTPDALLAGTALASGCSAVVGNDRLCSQRLTEPAYLYLSEHIGCR